MIQLMIRLMILVHDSVDISVDDSVDDSVGGSVDDSFNGSVDDPSVIRSVVWFCIHTSLGLGEAAFLVGSGRIHAHLRL